MNYPDVFVTSEKVDLLVTALVKFNEEMGVVAKKSKNPFFRSEYADLPSILEAIKEPMVKNNLTINHFPVGDNRLITRLSHTSGQYFQGMSYMRAVKDDPQGRGSVITYMMRYAVGAHLGLSIDKDDDANQATHRTASAAQKSTPLKTLTEGVKDAMLKYIEDGNIEAVKKQLPKYNDGKLKTIINKAITEAANVADLDCDATEIDITS